MAKKIRKCTVCGHRTRVDDNNLCVTCRSPRQAPTSAGEGDQTAAPDIDNLIRSQYSALAMEAPGTMPHVRAAQSLKVLLDIEAAEVRRQEQLGELIPVALVVQARDEMVTALGDLLSPGLASRWVEYQDDAAGVAHVRQQAMSIVRSAFNAMAQAHDEYQAEAE